MSDPFDARELPPPPLSEMAIRFERFHAENPRVYQTLVRLAYEWIDATGSRRLGIKTLYERCRWEVAIATSDPEYKLSNNWHAFYARLIMWNEPELEGLFVLRPSMADDWVRTRLAQLGTL